MHVEGGAELREFLDGSQVTGPPDMSFAKGKKE